MAACLVLACAALPARAAASDARAPHQLVVGLAGGAAKVAELAPGASLAERAARLRRRPGVRSAAPNWLAHASDAPLDQGSAGVVGGWAADQWSLGPRPGGIRAAAAWDRLIAAGRPGGAGVVVAVVDSGIAYQDSAEHAASPDFSSAFVPGIDLIDDDDQPLDENGHGTHVAGTIAEQATFTSPSPTPDYLTGIAYGVSLMPIRVLDASGVGSTDDVATGILWAARHGAGVINVSLNFDPEVNSCRDIPTVCTAIRKADRLGAFVVASAGNALGARGRDRALFPGAAPGAFAVGATTEDGCLAEYSYFGRRTDLLAPGGGPARPGSASRPACDGRLAADPPAHLRLLSDELRQRLATVCDPPGRRHLDVGRARQRGRRLGARQRCRRARPRSAAARSSPALHGVVGKAEALLRARPPRRAARGRSAPPL